MRYYQISKTITQPMLVDREKLKDDETISTNNTMWSAANSTIWIIRLKNFTTELLLQTAFTRREFLGCNRYN